MKHKRLKLSTAFFLGIGLSGLQAQTMYVKQSTGTQTAYDLSGLQKLTFASGNIMVNKTSGSPDSYPLSGIRYLNFQDISFSIAAVEKQDDALLLFPNPVADLLNIQLPKDETTGCIVEILSIEGRVLHREKLNDQSNTIQVNVSAFPQGLYLCKISSPTSSKTTRFIKK